MAQVGTRRSAPVYPLAKAGRRAPAYPSAHGNPISDELAPANAVFDRSASSGDFARTELPKQNLPDR
jgi:hypothetical protein